jgi:hypothetical protein
VRRAEECRARTEPPAGFLTSLSDDAGGAGAVGAVPFIARLRACAPCSRSRQFLETEDEVRETGPVRASDETRAGEQLDLVCDGERLR